MFETQKLKGVSAVSGTSRSWEDVGFNSASTCELDVAKIHMGRLCQ